MRPLLAVLALVLVAGCLETPPAEDRVLNGTPGGGLAAPSLPEVTPPLERAIDVQLAAQLVVQPDEAGPGHDHEATFLVLEALARVTVRATSNGSWEGRALLVSPDDVVTLCPAVDCKMTAEAVPGEWRLLLEVDNATHEVRAEAYVAVAVETPPTPEPRSTTPPTTTPQPTTPPTATPPTPSPPPDDGHARWREGQGLLYDETFAFPTQPTTTWNRTDAIALRPETVRIFVAIEMSGAPRADDPARVLLLGPDGVAQLVCREPRCSQSFERPAAGMWRVTYHGQAEQAMSARVQLSVELGEPQGAMSYTIYEGTHDYPPERFQNRTEGIVVAPGAERALFHFEFRDPRDPMSAPPTGAVAGILLVDPEGREYRCMAGPEATSCIHEMEDPPAGLWKLTWHGTGMVRCTVYAKAA